jgi:hypothetical protein
MNPIGGNNSSDTNNNNNVPANPSEVDAKIAKVAKDMETSLGNDRLETMRSMYEAFRHKIQQKPEDILKIEDANTDWNIANEYSFGIHYAYLGVPSNVLPPYWQNKNKQ